GVAVLAELADRGIAATGLALAEPADGTGRAADPTGAGGWAGAGTGVAAADGYRATFGDARDPSVVARALADVDAVIHLAAIPTPTADLPRTVFENNTLATFAVLNAAAEAGVQKAAIASSLSITGLPFAPVE